MGIIDELKRLIVLAEKVEKYESFIRASRFANEETLSQLRDEAKKLIREYGGGVKHV